MFSGWGSDRRGEEASVVAVEQSRYMSEYVFRKWLMGLLYMGCRVCEVS